MKKLSALLMILVLILCGCAEELPEETGALDYEKMDKEFGQFKEKEDDENQDVASVETEGEGSLEESGSSNAYKAELPAIRASLEQYTKYLLDDDARGYAKTFPDNYIIAIMNTENCTWDEAVAYAETQIKKTFAGLEEEYSLIASMKGDFGFSVSVKNITVFDRKTELIRAYDSYGMSITDAIEVDFIITVSEENRNAYVRLVKLENGSWAPDMSYFEI